MNYTVRIDSKIHGKARPSTEVTVFSENSPRFFPMYVGQQYVLYLQPEYGRYQVDNCGNSHAIRRGPVQMRQTNSRRQSPAKVSKRAVLIL